MAKSYLVDEEFGPAAVARFGLSERVYMRMGHVTSGAVGDGTSFFI